MSSSTADTAPTFSSAKRLSLNISSSASPASAPRPLHLLDSNALARSPSTISYSLDLPSPACQPLSSGSSSTTLPLTPLSARRLNSVRIGNARRQSSISYISSSQDDSPRSPFVRSVSVDHGGGSCDRPKGVPGDRRSTGSINPKNVNTTGSGRSSPKAGPQPPLTLVEKHAELLHFIAQKESKCLELRSQLATHEAELLQLKRKWERIVARGFEKTTGDGALSSSTISMNSPNNNNGGAVLEGIKGGVQGVSRFISANLSEFSAPSSPSPSPASPLAWKGPGHAAQSSTTSTTSSSSAASKSTTCRYSLSSASSLGESPVLEDIKEAEDQKERQCEQLNENTTSGRAVKDVKTIRRRSRDCSSSTANGASTSPVESLKSVQKPNKRSSMSVNGVPPPASIPGLVSMTMGNAWTGGLGKKWEELSKGPDSTFSKSQKRASVLLSDVSQSIYSALASPSLQSNGGFPSPKTPSHVQSSLSPPGGIARSPSALSLLDDDDEDQLATGGVLKPDALIAPTRPTTTLVLPETKRADDDDEEWNW